MTMPPPGDPGDPRDPGNFGTPHPGHEPGRPRDLLDEPALVMQQISSMMSNNFEIANGDGQVVGYVETTGSALGRMMMGSRSLKVHDTAGPVLVSVEDTVNFLRDTYELSDGHGQPLAHVRKWFALFRTQVDMHLADGTVVELHGNLWDFNFEFRLSDRVVAQVSRQWSGLGNAFLGRSTYAVLFQPEVPRNIKATIVGGMIALDLIRRKDDND